MDGLSVAASIITVVQLTGSVITYLSDVKEAPKECSKCMEEVSNSSVLLVRLNNRLKESSSGESWYSEIEALAKGPLNQYLQALENLRKKVNPWNKIRRLKIRLSWTLVKDDVMHILMRAERLKSLVSIALEMDHL